MSDDTHILVVEDDARLRERLARYLTGEGFRVTAAADAEGARARMRGISPDLLVLDVMMPGESGLDLTRSLREEQGHDLPVLMLTARGAPEDRIAGFEAGADDYLPKPFEPRELVLRIRALLRRAPAPVPVAPPPSGPVRIGTASFDIGRGELTGPGGPIRLTGGEAALLTALASRPGEILSREDIAAALGTDDSGERAVDVQVTRLRRKIEADPREPRFLHTVRGRGYVLKPGVYMRTRLPGTNWLKRFMPKSLLGRSLLMILIPLVALQAVTFQMFYGSHLDIVSRRLSGAIAGEISLTAQLMNRFPGRQDHDWILSRAQQRLGLEISLEPGAKLTDIRRTNILGPMDDDLEVALHEAFQTPFEMDWDSDPRAVLISIQVTDGVLHVVAPRKRLYSTTIYLFVPWVVGTALLLFGVAALFMRNQVRGIRRLARAAEAFGLGRETPPIHPEGATEVRQAAAAFNRMQDRIRRFLAQRTEMLAGVSHDLRTPLTRLRLALAMLPRDEAWHEDVSEMTADVEEMERMIRGYLSFARGEGTEQAAPVDLSAMLTDVATAARRGGANIEVSVPDALTVSLRADAIRRAITNLVDNARRHAGRVMLSAVSRGRSVLVNVDDDGPGIAAEQREDVFRPFLSGSAGGTGLGLTIARDIVRAHGGDISLEDSPLGGLRARVRLPV